jgi:hypothetical protein
MFPRTTWTGASAPSLASTSGVPTSPAWMMGSQPASAATACGRSKPWVSEIAPMVRIMPTRLQEESRTPEAIILGSTATVDHFVGRVRPAAAIVRQLDGFNN